MYSGIAIRGMDQVGLARSRETGGSDGMTMFRDHLEPEAERAMRFEYSSIPEDPMSPLCPA